MQNSVSVSEILRNKLSGKSKNKITLLQHSLNESQENWTYNETESCIRNSDWIIENNSLLNTDSKRKTIKGIEIDINEISNNQTINNGNYFLYELYCLGLYLC